MRSPQVIEFLPILTPRSVSSTFAKQLSSYFKFYKVNATVNGRYSTYHCTDSVVNIQFLALVLVTDGHLDYTGKSMCYSMHMKPYFSLLTIVLGAVKLSQRFSLERKILTASAILQNFDSIFIEIFIVGLKIMR